MTALNITEENFSKEVLESDIPVFIDFWAPWCGPCKALTPIIDELASEYQDKVKICKINVDENMGLSAKFQITSIPCMILFKEGKPIMKMIGIKPKEELKKVLNDAI